jgi:alpha-galactosidase
MKDLRPTSLVLSCCAVLAALVLSAAPARAADTFEIKPHAPGDPIADGPVQVYILSGQSNMVGIGQVDGGGSRWGDEFIDPVLSVYPGQYDPDKDYDKLKPSKTVELESFGGVRPTPYPGGGVQIVRGTIKIKTTGVYEMRPGYGGSTHNIMQVDGKEVYRKEPGGAAKHTPVKLNKGEAVPFKITYLTNDANGLGWIARLDIPGTLKTVVREEGKFPYLADEEGGFVPRRDVWYKGVVTAGANKWLAPGCGAGANSIGPELGFGHVMGTYHDQPVLILKASQGNRSLGWDFLPPGSERYEHTDANGKTWVYAGYKDSPSRWEKGTDPEPINWYAGKQYDDCFGAAHEVLNNFDKNFPMWEGRGYEIAGFVWWQGHKDSGSELSAKRYEQNLVHLIKTLRKEFEAPKAPFVVATIGFDGKDMDGNFLTIAEGQLAMNNYDKYPSFKGNVKTVDTRGFWRTPERSPRNQGFHYNGNAETYMLVGEAMGRGMVELLQDK